MYTFSKSTPTEAPLSHRKQLLWNTSSVVPPLILWLCDITLHHHVIHFHNLMIVASLACKNWFNTDEMLLLGTLGQACVGWPIRGDWGVLKRLEPKQSISDKGGLQILRENWCVSYCKCITSFSNVKWDGVHKPSCAILVVWQLCHSWFYSKHCQQHYVCSTLTQDNQYSCHECEALQVTSCLEDKWIVIKDLARCYE